MADESGTIESGKLGDFVVLDAYPFWWYASVCVKNHQ
jgi:imidazolonepropionase-like amidohydrolase